MDSIVIRDFYGEDSYRYGQLVCTSFHGKSPSLLNREAYIQGFIQEEEAVKLDKTELKGNYQVKKGLFLNGRLVTALKVHAFVVNFDGQRCEMGGIGGVVSEPEMRGKGFAGRVCEEALKDMKKKGQILSHLYPFQTSFYRRYGYEHCLTKIKWTIPIDYFPKGDCINLFHYENTEAQKADIKSVYQAFSEKYNLSVAKSPAKWDGYLKCHNSYDTDRYSYLRYDGEKADGFLSYRIRNHEDALSDIIVDNLYFVNADSLRDMLAFLKSFSAYVKAVEVTLPSDVDLTFILRDMCGGYNKKNVKREVICCGATRVVDVEEILKITKYAGKGSADIRVIDTVCPWNDKCYHVKFDQTCTEVSEGTVCDIELDINAFTALILGSHTLEDCAFMKNIKIYGNMENLKKVFYQKPAWIEEAF